MKHVSGDIVGKRARLTIVRQEGTPREERLVQSIPLPDVDGRIDHFSVDVKGRRAFLAALTENRPRLHTAVVACSALFLGLAVVQWALWQWVA